MPYKLSENGLSVLKEDGTLVKTHDSKEKARAHLAALEANVADAKSFLELMNIGEATKYGATISSANMKKVQAMHDFCHELGAKCEGEMEAEPEEKSFAVPKDKELNLSYVKSLGTAIDAQNIAVKYLSRNEIKGYTFLWGDPEKKLIDVEIEYFTKDSDFWDKALSKNPRPLTWDHAQDESFKASPIIGEIVDFGDDDLGRWYVAKLDTAHRYKEVINQLIKDGVLGTSSDSAPQYVTRSKKYDGDWFDQQSNGTWKSDSGKVVKSISGATWLKQWPWFASALTNVPAEPRMVDSLEFLKSLGVQLPEVALSQRQRYEHLKRQSEILKLKEKVG